MNSIKKDLLWYKQDENHEKNFRSFPHLRLITGFATGGAGTTHPYGAPAFTPGF